MHASVFIAPFRPLSVVCNVHEFNLINRWHVVFIVELQLQYIYTDPMSQNHTRVLVAVTVRWRIRIK